MDVPQEGEVLTETATVREGRQCKIASASGETKTCDISLGEGDFTNGDLRAAVSTGACKGPGAPEDNETKLQGNRNLLREDAAGNAGEGESTADLFGSLKRTPEQENSSRSVSVQDDSFKVNAEDCDSLKRSEDAVSFERSSRDGESFKCSSEDVTNFKESSEGVANFKRSSEDVTNFKRSSEDVTNFKQSSEDVTNFKRSSEDVTSFKQNGELIKPESEISESDVQSTCSTGNLNMSRESVFYSDNSSESNVVGTAIVKNVDNNSLCNLLIYTSEDSESDSSSDGYESPFDALEQE